MMRLGLVASPFCMAKRGGRVTDPPLPAACPPRAYPCELASLARVPFRPERGRTVQTRLILPLGGFLFDGGLSKDRRVSGGRVRKVLVCSSIVQHRRRRQTVGPPGSVSERSAPVIARFVPSCWCCSLFRPAKRKDVCRIDRPFARTLNGHPLARGHDSGNLLLLACLPSEFPPARY